MPVRPFRQNTTAIFTGDRADKSYFCPKISNTTDILFYCFRKKTALLTASQKRIPDLFSYSMSMHCPIFTARCYASAVLAIGLCPSVCVCLSLCHKPVFY